MPLGLVVTVFVWTIGLSLRHLAQFSVSVVVNAREPQLGLWFGTDLSGTPALIASVIGVVCSLMLFRLADPAGYVATVGLGLFTGGAASNTTERLWFASVVDYVPVPGTDGILANFGDVALTAGFALFAVSVIRFHLARVIAASWARRFEPR